ncbi:MAG: DEAD/DEAH box helicase [Rothia sp. (in: high G+C Gram-positive bacteria)]|uniref:DEAD/DEAH box helicase n=1 Tax=Rothia sp. (in: high G+C Gram-positive bacteria) TaxID=1885016 RepID=UPI0026DF1B3F|nr:DEAD/DEAH box helicase [Rothia sp. (in: high G+C Gram-positive bacteria)]MDO5750564.1 DEAD/DEAH box helicase [Rothia sp. (in: high G+C Gram-positive bacteria)]
MSNPLAPFSPETAAWFSAAFGSPTAAQAGAWESISRGDNTLIIAPTGSGKTLASFLWALDSLHKEPSKGERTRVLYISPLKALGADVERNLRAPLAGIARYRTERGLEPLDISVGVRSGDTPARERRSLIAHPPDILITTPESLYLMLTSSARNALAHVDTVIIDEVHALAGDKRGAHLALSLERLDQLLERPAQRIGLSATVNPVSEVARFLGGAQPVTIVQPVSEKSWQLLLSVPVPDLSAIGGANDYGQGEHSPSAASTPSTKAPGLQAHGARGQRPQTKRPASARPNVPAPVSAGSAASPYGSISLEQALGIFPGEEQNNIENNTRELEGLTSAIGPEASNSQLTPREETAQIDTVQIDTSGYRASIWPHVQESILHRIQNNRSTIVFVNSRGLAEKLTAALNEMHERNELLAMQARGEKLPAIGQESPIPPLARAHHGSVAKDQRTLIEEALKSGQLRCVVATSSLELGIDMGSVDEVIQVATPPSVASALQRVGRAGHNVGDISRGTFYPKHRGDNLTSAVVLTGMRAGILEPLRVPSNPLDVLAQQTVAAAALAPIDVDAWYATVTRAAPFSSLPRALFDAVLEMLAGRYPSDEFAELRPRLIWHRPNDEEEGSGALEARPGAQRLAVTNGGTIADRGLFPVFLAGPTDAKTPKRVGELDEEMVYESRTGDVIALGASAWRIEEITHDSVRVSPAPGEIGRLPFWHGERTGRPVELGHRIGEFVQRIVHALGDESQLQALRAELSALSLDEWAIDNLFDYIAEQRATTQIVPTDKRLVIERFRDELGDWRIILHSPLGYPVHAPWALALSARVQGRFGLDASVLASDDGIVMRLPATAEDLPDEDIWLFDPADLESTVREHVGDSALFAARFRESAARALLLPRRDPGKRTPLWQQRQRAAQLLDVARKFPDFPILLEAARECLQDVYDLPQLLALHKDIAAGSVSVHRIVTDSPSPFARTLLFEYVAENLYNTDAPAAERRAAALALDPTLLAELLGSTELRELLEPDVLVAMEQQLQRLGSSAARLKTDSSGRWIVEPVVELLRTLGPLSADELLDRVRLAPSTPFKESGADALEPVPPAVLQRILQELQESRRIFSLSSFAQVVEGTNNQERPLYYATVEDAARLRDGLGIALPTSLPEVYIQQVPAPLEDLVSRYARTHLPFSSAQLAEHLSRLMPITPAALEPILRELAQQGRVQFGEFMPEQLRAGTGVEWVDVQVLRSARLRSLAALRREIAPVPARVYGAFLPAWQQVITRRVTLSQAHAHTRTYGAYRAPERVAQLSEPVGEPLRGMDGLLTVVDQLAGTPIPASALEQLVLAARLEDYSPQLLDSALAAGTVLLTGAGTLGGGGDGWVCLHLSESAQLTVPDAATRAQAVDELNYVARALYRVLSTGGAFFPMLAQRVYEDLRADSAPGEVVEAPSSSELAEALWELFWAGAITNDTFAPLRARLQGARTAHAVPKAAASSSRLSFGGMGSSGMSSSVGSRSMRGASRLRSARFASGAGGFSSRSSRLSGTTQAPAADVSGRWSVLDEHYSAEPLEPTVAAWARAELLLDRYGVLTRGSAALEQVPGGFAALYRVYAAAEERALVRRGYFISGLGGAQFASPSTVDALRLVGDSLPEDPASERQVEMTVSESVFGSFQAVLLAACDPAQPYGAALDWPAVLPFSAGSFKHRPGRKAGACVVLLDGEPTLYIERGSKTLLAFTHDPLLLEASAPLVAQLVRAGAMDTVTVEKVNDLSILDSPEPVEPNREHPVIALRRALQAQGFYAMPKGLRLRKEF